ncbi:MAG: hypothetical protein CVT92_01840 [Bacteroidetes bacterium HGW-Bacteroidetes-1]|jgi:signal transduction histidine kinase|nr:MAG: hypothetical protein CVT92_01840 [Bacteroidetes bacterium HGW-Bacteroidetes-1]
MKKFKSHFLSLRGIIYFFLCVLFIYFTFWFINGRSNRKVTIGTYISNVIHQQQEELSSLSDYIVTTIGSDSLSEENGLSGLFYNNDLINESIGIYIFRDDILEFWNNNGILVDEADFDQICNQNDILQVENGYYLIQCTQYDSIRILLVKLIYASYPIENAYFLNGFTEIFGSAARNFMICEAREGAFPVMDQHGKLLFYLTEKTEGFVAHTNTETVVGFIFILVILSFIYLVIYKIYGRITYFVQRPLHKLFFYFADLLIIQFLLRSFDHYLFPFDTQLFHPVLYSSGFLFPSMGFLILHLHASLFVAISFFVFFPFKKKTFSRWYRFFRLIVFSFSFQFVLILMVFFAENIFLNASVPISFTEIYTQNIWSYFVFAAVGLLAISSLLIAFRIFTLFYDEAENDHYRYLAFFAILIINATWLIYAQRTGIFLCVYLFLFFLIGMRFHKKEKQNVESPSVFFLYFIISSALFTFLIYNINILKSNQQQLLTAQQLSADNDPMFEFLFPDVRNRIASDTIIKRLLASNGDLTFEDENIIYERISELYIIGSFDRYSVERTFCSPERQLLIQPENITVNCADYFDDLIISKGRKANAEGLYLIDDNVQGIYYLSVIPFIQDELDAWKIDTVNLYLEFYFKYIPEGLGYPELLIDESRGLIREIANYSFATYKNGILVYKFGSYLYPQRFKDSFDSIGEFLKLNGFNHFSQSSGNDTVIIVSKKTKSIADAIAPFSYFFFLISFFGFVVLLSINHKYYLKKFAFTFRMKLQMLILSSLLVSFVIIGLSTIYYITNVYKEKNNDFLAEKTQSILIELEHKLKNEDLTKENLHDYLHQLLLKFSLVFFSDINIFDLNGRLIASSRPEIFDQGLISKLMNPMAFKAMNIENKLFYLHQEHIGNGQYLSSYVPFKDAQGNALAYINLPYFAKESERRNEISTLVLAYINIFLLLMGISVTLVLILSRRLTQPLQMIQQKMRMVRIDKVNEKIAWRGKDEIGQLVTQYNTLLDQLAESAGRLARSERESAWREMARQVAHEIKNPLTPMRLSVQYLLKAWNEKDADIDQKLNNTTQTLINQIDTLSSIASAFSDFANMPVNKPVTIQLELLIQQIVTLFDNRENILFQLEMPENEELIIVADQGNINRIFTNIIKNSIQAIGNKENGVIKIWVESHKDNYFIAISDNGKGMTENEKQKVFTPNFTTKSSGMGIGLSMVYNMISAAGGTISFETEQGSGTTFHIVLPKSI